MTYDKRIKDFYDYLGWLFGLDRLEINRINDSTLEMKAIISSEKTVLTCYKIFLSYIHEIENSKNDPEALIIFKKNLTEYKNAFDNHMDDICKKIDDKFKNYKVDITLSYEGEFKTVYSKITELVN